MAFSFSWAYLNNVSWVKPVVLKETERTWILTNGLWGRLHVIHHTTVAVQQVVCADWTRNLLQNIADSWVLQKCSVINVMYLNVTFYVQHVVHGEVRIASDLINWFMHSSTILFNVTRWTIVFLQFTSLQSKNSSNYTYISVYLVVVDQEWIPPIPHVACLLVLFATC